MNSGHQRGRTLPDLGNAAIAVERLDPSDPVVALAHLLTPRSCAVGVGVRVADAVVSFRGRSVDVAGRDLPEAAGDVCDLVMAGVREGDEFLDLGADPDGWLEPVRSGAHVLLAGSVELFDGPTVAVDAVVFTPALMRTLSWAVTARIVPVLGADEGTLEVGEDGSWLVSPARPLAKGDPAEAPTSRERLLREAARSASVVDGWLGAVSGEWTPQPASFPGTLDLLGSLRLPDGHEVEVPLTQAATSRLVGVPAAQILPDMSISGLPLGFAPVGIRLRDGVSVVEHLSSGVRAALIGRPATIPVAGSICVEES